MTEGLDPFDQPLRHLRRVAPPWAAEDMTICGRPLSDVASWVQWEEAKALFNKHGRARAMFLFCATCVDRHGYKGDSPGRFDRVPAKVTADWAERAAWRDSPQAERIRAELLGLAALVEAHRDEYDAHVAAQLGNELTARRAARKRPGR